MVGATEVHWDAVVDLIGVDEALGPLVWHAWLWRSGLAAVTDRPADRPSVLRDSLGADVAWCLWNGFGP